MAAPFRGRDFRFDRQDDYTYLGVVRQDAAVLEGRGLRATPVFVDEISFSL